MAKIDKYGKIIWENTYQEEEMVKTYIKVNPRVEVTKKPLHHSPDKFSADFSYSPFHMYMTDIEKSNLLVAEDEVSNVEESVKSEVIMERQNIKPMEIILEEGVVYPSYAHAFDAGFDLRSNMDSFDLLPDERVLIKTGLRVRVPVNYELQIRPRSGLALKEGLTVLNTPGTIDSSYSGEIGVILYNTSSLTRTINRDDRVAQAILTPIVRAHFIQVESFPNSDRGDAGFGSTGK